MKLRETVAIVVALFAVLALAGHCLACHDAKVALAETAFDADLTRCEKLHPAGALRDKCTDDALLAWHIAQAVRRDAGGDQ